MIDTDRYNSWTYVKTSDTELQCVRNHSVQWGTKIQRVHLSPFCRHNCRLYWRKPNQQVIQPSSQVLTYLCKMVSSTTKPSTVPKFKQTSPQPVQKISQNCNRICLCLHIQCMSVRPSERPSVHRAAVWCSGIRKVPGLNICRIAVNRDGCCTVVSVLGNETFLPYPYQFISHPSIRRHVLPSFWRRERIN